MPESELSRARTWLGTLVEIRARHVRLEVLEDALERAYARIAQVHARMSVHEAGSDLRRLHAAAPGTWVPLAPDTCAVLEFALELSRRTDGVFDPCVGALLGLVGALPVSAPSGASWRDLELAPGRARCRRPLLLDLGGVAKGYAVDQALAELRRAGCSAALVNAGGDLACFGPEPEPVHVRVAGLGLVPLLALSAGALASSCYAEGVAAAGDGRVSALIDPRTGAPAARSGTISVTAPTAMSADALTKVVALMGDSAAPILREYAAQAALLDGTAGSLSLRFLPTDTTR